MGLEANSEVLFRTSKKNCERHKCSGIITVNNKDIIYPKGRKK